MNSLTDAADLVRPESGQSARNIHIVDAGSYEGWLTQQPDRTRAALVAQGFKATENSHAILPGETAEGWGVVTCVAKREALSSWCLATLSEVLPEGSYRLAEGEPGAAMLGWILGQYRFDRYKTPGTVKGPRILLTGKPGAMESMVAQARATILVRDMVNTPTADMGPGEIEAIAEGIARRHGAQFSVVRGDALETGYPMIHAVGRAADRANAPRLIEFHWGKEGAPRIAIVGKGVCFDSGGLDIKPAAGMRLMKKDMGGAAHALALAELVMAANLPVRLHCLVPAVENAISGNAFRPGDILRSRKGLSVEIGNTDAEGRLILGDALARASEEQPELIIDFATLTGAARVALGPDLPATFTNDDTTAERLSTLGMLVDDPLWRLPLWQPYHELFKSDVADLNNSGESGFAGTITAALFLEKFIFTDAKWVHFDTFAWRPANKPGRRKGGDAIGLRAAFAFLAERYAR
jgi:leucyl aminopeptidase